MKISNCPDTSCSINFRVIPLAISLGVFAFGLSMSSCSTATRSDSPAVGSGNANYPISDTGLNEQYEKQNKLVRELGM